MFTSSLRSHNLKNGNISGKIRHCVYCYKPINCKFICLTVYLTASSSGVFNLSLSKLGDCGWEEKAINWLEARAALALRLLLPFVRLEGLEGCSNGLVVELNWDSMLESSNRFLLLSSKEDLLLAVSTIFLSLKCQTYFSHWGKNQFFFVWTRLKSFPA